MGTIKKMGMCTLSLMLIFALVNTSWTQGIKLGGKADSAKEIVISGQLDVTAAYLDSGITSIMDGMADNPATTTRKEHQKSAFIRVPLITLNFDIDAGEKVTALFQLENQPLNNARGGAALVDVMGQDNTEMEVEQAYIKVSEFLLPELTFTYGIQDLKFTLREGEGAFFMDVAESELATTPTVSQPEAFHLNVATDGAANQPDALLRDTTEFGGLRLDYGSLDKDNYALCFFYGTVAETDPLHQDEAIKGLQFNYKLPGDNNVLKVMLANTTEGAQGMNFNTLGVGATYWAQPQLECYGELYLQSGDYAKQGSFNTPATGILTLDVPAKAVDQDATAIKIGARYNVEHDMKPYVDASYWALSGDDGDPTKDNEDFISYENVQSTLIMEGNFLGLDLDSNYTAIKIETGITTQVDINSDGTGEELKVKLLVGMFDLAEEPKATWNRPAANTKLYGTGISGDLGNEIDVVVTLKYSESLSFTLGLGMVSGADYFEGADHNLDTLKDSGFMMADTDMTLVMFTAGLKF